MSEPLFPNFLTDHAEYAKAERYWLDLWESIDPAIRTGWVTPWLTGSAHLKDGNPIFTAWSPTVRKAIRVLQEEPDGSAHDTHVWFDSFGERSDPVYARELVMTCVLTRSTADAAREHMMRWIKDEPIR